MALPCTATWCSVNVLCHLQLCRYNLPNAPGFLLKPLLSLGSVFTKTPEQGAQTSIYLATSHEVDGVSGKYFSDCKPVTTSKESYDPEVSHLVTL